MPRCKEIQWKNGSFYTGELKGEDTPHGVGVISYGSEGKYAGQFSEGVPHGVGIMTFESGDVFIGSFVDGKYDGFGILFGSTDITVGEWNEGAFVHPRIIKWKDGSFYTGELKGEDTPHGVGVISYGPEGKYAGQFSEGVPHGVGIMTFESGDVFIGSFVDGKYDGFGILFDSAGSVITEGEWDEGAFVNSQSTPQLLTHGDGNVVSQENNSQDSNKNNVTISISDTHETANAKDDENVLGASATPPAQTTMAPQVNDHDAENLKSNGSSIKGNEDLCSVTSTKETHREEIVQESLSLQEQDIVEKVLESVNQSSEEGKKEDVPETVVPQPKKDDVQGGYVFLEPINSEKDDSIYLCVYEDGSAYRGEWKDNKPNGTGIYLFLTGDQIKGTWENGSLCDKGEWTRPDGTKQCCSFREGRYYPL